MQEGQGGEKLGTRHAILHLAFACVHRLKKGSGHVVNFFRPTCRRFLVLPEDERLCQYVLSQECKTQQVAFGHLSFGTRKNTAVSKPRQMCSSHTVRNQTYTYLASCDPRLREPIRKFERNQNSASLPWKICTSCFAKVKNSSKVSFRALEKAHN